MNALVLLSLVSLVGGQSIFFDGFGEYLCDYYDGEDNVCMAPSTTGQQEICMTVCSTCDEDTLETAIAQLVNDNPDPPTGSQSGLLSPILTGNDPAETSVCDSTEGWTVIFKDQLQHKGQLDWVEWYVSSACSGNNGLVFGIFRSTGSCSYTVQSTQEIPLSSITPLLNGQTSGKVKYNFKPTERLALQFEDGDYFGIRWKKGSNLGYSTGGTVEKVCLADVNAWVTGDSLTLITTATHSLRDYQVQWAYSAF